MGTVRISVIAMISVMCIGSAVFGNDLLRKAPFETGAMTAQMQGGMMGGGGMGDMTGRTTTDMLPSGIPPRDLPAPDSPGARLLVRYCDQCHNLPSPGMHPAKDWPRIAERMFYLMSTPSGGMGMMHAAVPSAGEQQTIVAYLRTFALKSIAPEAVPSRRSRGAALFQKYCSRCHGLPDLKMHSASEWPRIVDRMQSHSAEMGIAAIPERDRKDIVNYLTSHASQ
jgi:cytochrome c5